VGICDSSLLIGEHRQRVLVVVTNGQSYCCLRRNRKTYNNRFMTQTPLLISIYIFIFIHHNGGTRNGKTKSLPTYRRRLKILFWVGPSPFGCPSCLEYLRLRTLILLTLALYRPFTYLLTYLQYKHYNRKYIRKKKDIFINLTNTNFYNITQAFQQSHNIDKNRQESV